MTFSARWSHVPLRARPFGFFAFFHGVCGDGETEYDPPFHEYWTLYIGKLWIGANRDLPHTPSDADEGKQV